MSQNLIQELILCLTEQFDCNLVRQVMPGLIFEKGKHTPANWYTSVFQHKAEMGTPLQLFLYQYLANLTAYGAAGYVDT